MILCGRGGSINAHSGNVTFRQWIQERRESYNLADTKSAKTRVTNEIFQRVRSLRPPGRFLQKTEAPVTNDNVADDVDWWTEVDDTKALAKISQALREGAPAFRAAHGKPRKSQRTSQRRRNSLPSKKKLESKRKPSPKRCKTESPPSAAAYQRLSMAEDMDISPPYYIDDAAGPDIHFDVGNFDTVFNHNQIQSYRNAVDDQLAGYGIATDRRDGSLGNNNRFDQFRTLSSHPLVNMGDYQASISDVASAIPPTPPTYGKRRVTSFISSDFLPRSHTPSQVSPYSMQYEQFDPYSFLSPVPSGENRIMPNNTNQANHICDQKVKASTTSSYKREHSLSFSESEMHEEAEEFTNPFENEELLNQAARHQAIDEDSQSKCSKPTTTFQVWELPYTTQYDPFPSPHVTPPARGLSFGGIGTIPTGHFLASSRKSSVTSSGDVDKVPDSAQQNSRNENTKSISKEDEVITCQQCQF
ncbi:hypothetical protein HJC23_007722 [Cyclotella cryptica]|uniref:DUF6824 domain-containing protein n=1 Tax=Cyclotella cryptica TaxID=29204 RepID=A0ABD3PB08_9STRA